MFFFVLVAGFLVVVGFFVVFVVFVVALVVTGVIVVVTFTVLDFSVTDSVVKVIFVVKASLDTFFDVVETSGFVVVVGIVAVLLSEVLMSTLGLTVVYL